jgi:hypothetical protein
LLITILNCVLLFYILLKLSAYNIYFIFAYLLAFLYSTSLLNGNECSSKCLDLCSWATIVKKFYFLFLFYCMVKFIIVFGPCNHFDECKFVFLLHIECLKVLRCLMLILWENKLALKLKFKWCRLGIYGWHDCFKFKKVVGVGFCCYPYPNLAHPRVEIQLNYIHHFSTAQISAPILKSKILKFIRQQPFQRHSHAYTFYSFQKQSSLSLGA